MAYQFGVATAPGSYGKIQSFTSSKSGERGYAPDENGDVAAANTYNEKEEVSFEYIFDGTAPVVGVTLTIGAVKYTVLTVELTESNTDYKKMSVTAERFITNTIPTT